MAAAADEPSVPEAQADDGSPDGTDDAAVPAAPAKRRRGNAAASDDAAADADAQNAADAEPSPGEHGANGENIETSEEHDLLVVHPAWFVSRPGHAAIAVLAILAGLGFAIGGLIKSTQMLPEIGGGVFLLGAGFLGYWFLHSRSMSITVTSKRLIVAQGLFTRDTLDVPLREIQDIRLTQSLHERLLGTGRLSISNSSQSDDEIELEHIPNPQNLKKAIDKARKL